MSNHEKNDWLLQQIQKRIISNSVSGLTRKRLDDNNTSTPVLMFPVGQRPFDITKPPPYEPVPVLDPYDEYTITYVDPTYDNWVRGGWKIPDWRQKIARFRKQ